MKHLDILETQQTVMLVDDEIANLEQLNNWLEKDYRIIGVMRGETTLEEAADYQPDLILLDTQMPHSDGYEICRQLKNDARCKHIPVILMGHMENKKTPVKSSLGLDLGAVDYLNKPFNRAIVKARVRNHLSLQRKNRLLETAMKMDSTTLMPNHDAFEETLETEWARCMRSEALISTIIIDIDMFRHYNDHYGHSAGNDCLSKIGNTLATCSKRPGDFVAHYNDKVFAAILTDTDHDGALQLAEVYKQSIENLHIPHAYSGTTDHVTVSIGVGTVSPTTTMDTSAKMLMDASYDFLHQAENNGYNRIIGKQL
ncbi:MAG: diguanylate cyclase [Pseudomonadales bacterium]|nr:diguanylate cyclase [Pseudomonadales bacterium]